MVRRNGWIVVDRDWRVAAIGGAIVICTLLFGCKPKTNTFAPPPPPEVTVSRPVQRPVTKYFEYTGTTEAFQQVELRARVAGFLEQVNFKPGAVVKRGDLLFVIDPRVYQAQERQAAADLEARKATLRLAELTLSRVSEANKSGAVSPLELDKASAEHDLAKAQVELAEASLADASLNVEFTQVRAPIDGRITKNLVDVGNLVGSSGQATVLATIVSSVPMYVTVDASESDVMTVRRLRLATAPKAEPGQVAPGEWRPVDLATADSESFGIRGHIDYVDPALNPMTGTIRVRCRFENTDNALIPGLFVRLRVLLETSDAILVPDVALLSDQIGRFAFVVNDKDVVEIKRVKIGVLDGGLRVVEDGLGPADRVVVKGTQRARPGITVKPALQEGSPGAAPPGSVAPTGEPKDGGGKPASGENEKPKDSKSVGEAGRGRLGVIERGMPRV